MRALKIWGVVKLIVQILVYGFVILLFSLVIRFFVQDNQGASYPSGNLLLPIAAPDSAYPYPLVNQNITSTPGNSYLTVSPTPLRDLKDGHILSPAEIGAIATYDYEGRKVATLAAIYPKSTLTLPSYPVSSTADLPQVVYHDPFYGGDEMDFGECIQAKNPEPALLVHRIDGKPDYYLVPFLKDNKICAVAIVEIIDSMGYVGGMGQAFGDKFPYGSADEASQIVNKKTGKQIDQIDLVYGYSLETYNPLYPYWQVTTVDNQTYYVVFITAISEGNNLPETSIKVLDGNEIHFMK
jgi:hypothetical protein